MAASIRGGVAVELGQEVSQDPPGLHVEFEARGVAEVPELLADMPAQPAQDVLARVAGDDALDDAATVDAVDNPPEDAADAHPAPVQNLLDAKLRARPLFDHRAAVAAQPPQVAEELRQHQARARESELADARQPDAVRDVGLAPLDLLDVLGIDHHDIETGIGQNVVDLLPEDARRLHDGAAHPQAEQPLHQKEEAARQRTEIAGVSTTGASLPAWVRTVGVPCIL